LQYVDKEKFELLKTLLEDIKNKKLKADNVVEQLFTNAEEIDYTPEIVERSKLRYDLGNPPGKGNSYGDALNWECLLTIKNNHLGEKYDLYFISDDKDYVSLIDKNDFNPFLAKEWNKQKGSKILFYKNLTDFFKENYSYIKLADDFERELLVSKLVNSYSFYNARYNLLALHNFGIGELSNEQVERILTASIDNTQINWISGDEDINKMLYKIIDKYDLEINTILLDKFKIEILRKERYSVHKIASLIGVHHSTVVRELNRVKDEYSTIKAQQVATSKSANKGRLINLIPQLAALIKSRL